MSPPSLLRRVLWSAAAMVLAAGCTHASKPRDGTSISASDHVPFPGDFTPPPPLPPPPGADPKEPGSRYLDLIYPRLRDGWNQFLEDCRLRLPPSHALNNAALVATVGFTVDRQGRLVDAAITTASGNQEFDDAAVGVVTDAAPFVPPEPTLLSDDEKVHVAWLFARDQRQAGAATAALRRVDWPLEQAVPKFLGSGDIGQAARRLGDAGLAPDGPGRAQQLELAERVMAAAVREGLASPDLAVQRVAIEVAAARRLTAAARELRSIADGALDIGQRAAAIDALAAVDDRDAVPLLRGILERDAGANAELTGAAARALAKLGAAADLSTLVVDWFAAGRAGATPAHRAKTWAALVASAGAPVARAIPDANRLLKAGDPAARGAACRSLGTAVGVDASAWKGLRGGLADADASVRAACAGAIADAAAGGLRNRSSYWSVAPLLRDRDERVRAAAVRAVSRLEPVRSVADLAAVARDRSPAVLASLAEAWVIGGAPDRTAALLGHEAPTVRLAAATALAAGDAAAHQRLAARPDLDPALRVLAIGVVTERGPLEAASTDPDPAVRVAAASRVIALRGRSDALLDVLAAITAAPPAGLERVRLAGAWLSGR